MHTFIHKYIHMYIMCICYVCSLHAHTHTYITCICYMRMLRVFITCMHAYIHTYRCTFIHTHVRMRAHMLTHISQSPYPFIDG